MVEIKWTDVAIEDVIHIGDYIERDSPKYTEIVVNKIFDTTEILETHPFVGRMVPEFSKEHIRELFCFNYRIVYNVLSENRVDILTVHHSARLLPKIDYYIDNELD